MSGWGDLTKHEKCNKPTPCVRHLQRRCKILSSGSPLGNKPQHMNMAVIKQNRWIWRVSGRYYITQPLSSHSSHLLYSYCIVQRVLLCIVQYACLLVIFNVTSNTWKVKIRGGKSTFDLKLTTYLIKILLSTRETLFASNTLVRLMFERKCKYGYSTPYFVSISKTMYRIVWPSRQANTPTSRVVHYFLFWLNIHSHHIYLLTSTSAIRTNEGVKWKAVEHYTRRIKNTGFNSFIST